MYTSYIVTVKLPTDPTHDPRNKKLGPCPLGGMRQCSDTTGAHHSFIVSTQDTLEQVKTDLETRRGWHVTRIEQM